MSLQHAASSPSAAYAVGRLDEHLAQIFKRGVGDVLDGCRVPTVPVAPLSIARIHADTDLCSCLNGRLQ
jgi:hypothetical protein